MRLAHVAVLVQDLDPMIAFYSETVGLQLSDVGTAAGKPGAPRIAFLSWDPSATHHQPEGNGIEIYAPTPWDAAAAAAPYTESRYGFEPFDIDAADDELVAWARGTWTRWARSTGRAENDAGPTEHALPTRASARKSARVPRKIATNQTVGRAELLDFLRPRHHFILFTTRADGRAQASPVSGGIDTDGRLVVSTYPQRAKVRNLRRRPAASVCVLSDDWNGPWVQVDGTAEVLDLPDALEPLVEYFRCISGEHPDWDEYRAAMQEQGKCLVRLTIERWGPIATGGFPPELADG